MHILYFHQHFTTPKGVAGTQSYEIAKRLILHGYRVTMVCGSYDAGDTGLLGSSNSDGFSRQFWVFLKVTFASIRIALFSKYDLVFATSTSLTAGIPAIFARWLRRKTFVFEVRHLWSKIPKTMGIVTNPALLWLMSALEWMSCRSVHRCIGLSPDNYLGRIADMIVENNWGFVGLLTAQLHLQTRWKKHRLNRHYCSTKKYLHWPSVNFRRLSLRTAGSIG